MPEPERYDPDQAPTADEVRANLDRPRVRRHAWINIAGPLSALALGVVAAAMYLRPIETLRWMQTTRLGWSGVTQSDLALKDQMITYYITGGYWDQSPVVMIHGLGPNAALVWRSVMRPVADAHFKVIAPNLPGFASSEHKQVNYTIASQADAVAQMIDELKLDHVNIIGQDLGADVALYYAVDHPDKVERLILLGGGLVGARGVAKLRKIMIPTTPEDARAEIEMTFFDLPPMPDFMYQRMQAALQNDLATQTQMLDSVPKDEGHIRSKLGQIFNTLTIVFWSGNNPFFTKADADALNGMLPGSAAVGFKTSGAYPQLEHPDDFAESVVYILKQVEGGE